MAGTATPLKAIVQVGTRIYTRDMAGRDELTAECRDVETASWAAWSLSEFHGCALAVEPAEAGPAITAKVEVQGRLDDPHFLELLEAVTALAGQEDDVPPEVADAFETYRMRGVAEILHERGIPIGRTGRAG